ncbi:hypothetical protein C8J57DRAFT_1606022 [Mycena rebaudengoi]|nr:hypothetical protein C8J57DRAFT_1606022 [Mycena rebaudengoi]
MTDTRSPSLLDWSRIVQLLKYGNGLTRAGESWLNMGCANFLMSPLCIILSRSTDHFYLEIPIAVVQSNSVHYLRFLGWCIISKLGTVKSDREGVDIIFSKIKAPTSTSMTLLSTITIAVLRYAVDPDVIKARSQVSTPSGPGATPSRTRYSNETPRAYSPMCRLCSAKGHILSHFTRVTSPDEDISALTTVNNRRNGMLLGLEVHVVAESRQVVVVHMSTTSRPVTLGISMTISNTRIENVTPFTGWTTPPQNRIRNNSDATFRKYTHIPKPSPMPLHYNYGAAAVKWWGHGKSHLEISNRPTMPRPSVPVTAATGPIRTKRTAAQLDSSIQKRATRNTGGSGSGPRESEAARDEEVMDPDEVVMFFWSENPAALERRKRDAEDRKREEEERASRMEQWRDSVIAV